MIPSLPSEIQLCADLLCRIVLLAFHSIYTKEPGLWQKFIRISVRYLYHCGSSQKQSRSEQMNLHKHKEDSNGLSEKCVGPEVPDRFTADDNSIDAGAFCQHAASQYMEIRGDDRDPGIFPEAVDYSF